MTMSELRDLGDDLDAIHTTRRIRHISSIQVRNLTPFPVRDAFTSALLQPNDTGQNRPYAVDDLDIAISRRRSRKVSANSLGSSQSVQSKWNGTVPSSLERSHSPSCSPVSVRGPSASRAHLKSSSGTSFGSSSSRGTATGRAPRPRTSSKASSASVRILEASSDRAGSASLPYQATQKGLEKVMKSRLLETCLVISVVEPPPTLPPQNTGPLSPRSATFLSHRTTEANGKAAAFPVTAPPNQRQFMPPTHSHGSSLSSLKNVREDTSDALPSSEVPTPQSDSKHSRQPSFGPIRNKVVSSNLTLSRPRMPSNPPKPTLQPLKLIPPGPTQYQYLSPIHRPSTNPEFVIGSNHFPEWNSLNARSLRVAIWCHLPADIHSETLGAAPMNPPRPAKPGFSWKIIDEWEVHLEDLIPISDETAGAIDLSSNLLLLTLSPPGQTYRLPRASGRSSRRSSRASTPAPGYASDPESTSRRRTDEEQALHSPSQSQRRRGGTLSLTQHDCQKTAAWPDIFQLATLQTCIADNNASLGALTRRIDEIVLKDDLSLLKREVSERQGRLEDLRISHSEVTGLCSEKRLQLQRRRESINCRRELLLLARKHNEDLEASQREQHAVISDHRSSLEMLRANIASIRAGLIAVLADIFPIDLYSPPDLLFTILDVPLPIPLSSNDPAPPLSSVEHKFVNEDAIAAALGYVAEVLLLLSMYLGTSLIYPVTCIGSRSLIRDGISSMVGPRTFPLYSKGVDTYRFEYGVFLLNKDIEILMADRELRALDSRHTLPNLKNLLLILSHDNTGRSEIRKRKPPDTPSSSILELDPDHVGLDGSSGSTPKGKPAARHESQTPPRSGATTPTGTGTMAEETRKSFFGFSASPLTDFLRGRYPASVRDPAKGGSEDGDDEDKRTIHGVVTYEDQSADDPVCARDPADGVVEDGVSTK